MKKALLIVDVDHYDRWSGEEIKKDKKRKLVADSIARRLAWARLKGIPVIFITIKNPYNRIAKFLNSEPALEPTFQKTDHDAFGNPKLAKYLQSIGAKKLLVAGCNTFICVEATAQGAVKAGFSVVLLNDAAYPSLMGSNSKHMWIRSVRECVPSGNKNKLSVTIIGGEE